MRRQGEKLLRRRLILPGIAVISLVAIGGLTLSVPPRASVASDPSSRPKTAAPVPREAQCDENAPAGVPVRWTARYDVTTQPGEQFQLHVVSAGGDSRVAEQAGAAWTIWWMLPDGSTGRQSSSADQLSTIRVMARSAVLLAPDGDCALVLSASDSEVPVAVIGDSIFAGIDTRRSTTGLLGATFASDWLITADGGFGWGASAPAWPLTTIRGSWAIGLARGLADHKPSSLVVELGANDALRATFADARHNPALAQQIRHAVAANISELLALSARLELPLVLVTVSTFPTTAFGGGLGYAREAALINAIIRSATATAPGEVAIADWAGLSASRHAARGDAPAWFLSDGLHPNETGEDALLALVRTAVQNSIQGR
jgi:lysophospholipase L1-like esterase